MRTSVLCYDRERILEKTKAGQHLVAAQSKHIGRPKGLDAENLAKVKKALDKGMSVAKTVDLTGIRFSSVKRYRKHLRITLPKLIYFVRSAFIELHAKHAAPVTLRPHFQNVAGLAVQRLANCLQGTESNGFRLTSFQY